MAQKYGIQFYECSAKTGEHVTELFKKIGGDIVEKYANKKPEMSISAESQSGSLVDVNKRKKRQCCKDT